ncbi:hypothetical protein DEU56DRAFT_805599 [Suillus clintonianus]|uniref:uncharacterized protein n=1 Tax=Suillus clintonianus TaxID=1904413 RepID=UPI001B867DFA|nr:uncharacterized protein DEU56DRAFT_805599 [Suillus clintonianus]KAG2136724.1 hypothetical protein DEU56DRAFT_805599 [Suillus clintonianus]
MDVSNSSSPAPRVTDDMLPSAEDTSVERPRTPESARHSPLEPNNDRNTPPSLQEILQMTSTTVNFISTITTLFHEKGEQNSRLREELRRKILFTAMNAHAWASARIVHEHTVARDTLEAGIHKLVEDEKDQDRMRTRLSEMFEAINNTVASLAGLG